MKLSLLVLRCCDLEISKHFYEKLGLYFVEEQHGTGPIHYSAYVDGTVLELYPSQAGGPVDATRLGFHVDDVRGMSKQFRIESTYDGPQGPVYIVVDPDGRKVELT